MHSPHTPALARRAWLSLAAALVALAALAVALAPSEASAQAAPGAEESIPAALATIVKARVASEAGVATTAVTIDRAERVVWQDGCLGIESQGTACTQALVSGHVVWATASAASATTYRFHTDYQGPDVRLAASDVADAAADPLPGGATLFEANLDALPAAIATQVSTLAGTRAAVPASAVTVLRVEDVTWEDACIGAAQGAESCAEVVTSGYVVWVSAGGNVYRYHTADDASNVRFGEGGLSVGDIPLFALPAGATAAEDDDDDGTDGLIVGDVPSTGLALLQVSAVATPASMVTGLVALGCAPVSISITESGQFVVYVPGAPAFVNADFPVSLPADAGFIVRCA
ncbi:MAG: hypothetical protein M0R73_04220 [Dehalococcoidia bacterium]|nr:hypothetical protein [Dehalococcoidia bacterium]